jgi:hypothetical protein
MSTLKSYFSPLGPLALLVLAAVLATASVMPELIEVVE